MSDHSSPSPQPPCGPVTTIFFLDFCSHSVTRLSTVLAPIPYRLFSSYSEPSHGFCLTRGKSQSLTLAPKALNDLAPSVSSLTFPLLALLQPFLLLCCSTHTSVHPTPGPLHLLLLLHTYKYPPNIYMFTPTSPSGLYSHVMFSVKPLHSPY